MLRDYVKEYYLDEDFNCAETILRCINDVYQLGLNQDDFKLVSGFGAGMGCGNACGALCGGIAALGRLLVNQRAHNTADFKEICAAYVEKFHEQLGDTMCDELVKEYKKEDVRCLETVEKAADLFEEYYESLSLS